MDAQTIFILITITIIILLCIFYYYYYYVPNQINSVVYKIPLITSEQLFDETYFNTIILQSQPSVNTRLYMFQNLVMDYHLYGKCIFHQ